MIVTFPKRGYSFVAPLTEVEAAVPEHLPADESAKEPASAEVEPLPVRRRSVRIARAAVLLVTIGLALSLRLLWHRPARIGSVAVLPFQTAEGQDSLLAAGFTQDFSASRLQCHTSNSCPTAPAGIYGGQLRVRIDRRAVKQSAKCYLDCAEALRLRNEHRKYNRHRLDQC